jgi:NDP-sugar pyrophosphorylase family protein
MRAVILAGGKGTRLRPYTTTLPKPLMPIGGEKPILEIVLNQLAQNGFDHITMAVNHMANLIMAFFGDGSKWGIKIDYSFEDKPLSTIGPLTLIPDLPENFLVMNGDILCNISYRQFFESHVQNANDVSVSTFKRDVKIDFGVIEYNEKFQVTAFIEKPVYHYDVSMGIYCLNRRIVDSLPRGEAYGFDNLMLDCLNTRAKVTTKPFDGFWLDIGRPEDYDYCNENYAFIKEKMGIEE